MPEHILSFLSSSAIAWFQHNNKDINVGIADLYTIIYLSSRRSLYHCLSPALALHHTRVIHASWINGLEFDENGVSLITSCSNTVALVNTTY